MPSKTAASKNSTKRRGSNSDALPQREERVMRGVNEDDVLIAGGASSDAKFGRCGGRAMSNKLELKICDMLSGVGIAHSHSPRHFEIRLDEKRVAAYAPQIVLRGRGREGKTVVLESTEKLDALTCTKITAFREQYGSEFYVSFIASEEILDEAPISIYDESTALTELHTLISRLAE